MLYANGPSALLWAISILLGFGLMALADDTPCTLHHEGKYYNLNSLKARYALGAIMTLHMFKPFVPTARTTSSKLQVDILST